MHFPDPYILLLWFIVFLLSLSVHESAHAYVSNLFGDDLGKSMGRISLNPIVHIDPIGTILFPLISSITGIPLFGWAKPVPVNPLAWREKNKANFWTSAAGPLSNFGLAALFFVILKTLLLTGALSFAGRGLDGATTIAEPIVTFLFLGIFVNVSLGIFNLIPIPPLDGSGVLESVLPYEAQKGYAELRPYGWLLLIVLMWMGAFAYLSGPIQGAIYYLLFLGS